MRFPTVFTAIGDIVCGSALALGVSPFVPELIPIVLASIGLYLSGMVLNDVFDYEADCAVRAKRPLPNGQLTLKFATRLGFGLMAFGLVMSALTWPARLGLAMVLAALILLYNGALKQTPLAPVVMGCCRGMNLILGASLVGHLPVLLRMTPVPWAALGLTIYITGVTLFARQEAVQSARWKLGLGLTVVIAGLGILGTMLFWQGHPESRLSGIILLLVIATTIIRRAIPAMNQGDPRLVQMTIKTMLLSLLMIHASLIYGVLGTAGLPVALTVLALLVPAMLLSRVIAVT